MSRRLLRAAVLAVLAVLATSLVMTRSAPTAVLTFRPTADTYVRYDDAATNYGTSLHWSTEGRDDILRNTLLRFDVQVPSGEEVVSARLRAHSAATASATQFVDVYTTSGGWAENGVTWDTAPPRGDWLSRAAGFDTGTWVEWDVTAGVPATGGQVDLKLESNARLWLGFKSREYGPANLRPQLQVQTAPAPSGNRPPAVDAGEDQTVTAPGPVTLNGSISDDGRPDPPASTSASWAKVSGPGTAVFSDAHATTTHVTFDQPGTHVLRLTGSDSALSAFDDVTVTVEAVQPGDGFTTAAGTLDWGRPVAGDEFDYIGAPDPAKWWVYDSPGHAGNGVRSPAQFAVNGSLLVITGTPDGTTGGMAALFDRRKYGRWETRMALPDGDNEYHGVSILWPDSENWPCDGEIDYAENLGDRSEMKFFNHHSCANLMTSVTKPVDATQFHNYAVEWTPDKIVGYLDGVEWFSDNDPDHLPPGPMHQTLQLDWFPDATTDGGARMLVDWVRVYDLPAVPPAPAALGSLPPGSGD
jgi:K319-like protein/glycosyl hydrolase family 16